MIKKPSMFRVYNAQGVLLCITKDKDKAIILAEQYNGYYCRG